MRRPLQRARILRRSDDRPPLTLPAALRRILRKYPSMLHIAGPAVPILGPELVSNGAFDTADGWSAATGWGISGGALNHTAPSTLMPALTVATQAGKTYQCAYSITSQSAAGSGVSLRLGSTNLTIRNAVGTYSETLTQTVDSAIVGFIARGASGDWLGSIDNLSVREIVGYQNTYASFAAGNYKESTGQTLAAVDQQVGLVVDAAASAIQITDSLNGFSPVGGLPNISLTAMSFTTTQTSLGVTIPCVVGKWYRVSAVGSTTSDIFSINTYDTSPARTEIKGGFGVCVFKADRPFIYLRNLSAGTTTLTSLSVEELPGTHAAQATSGYQPYLRQVPKTLGPELLSADGSGGSAAGWSTKLGGTLSSVAGRLRLAVPSGNADRAVSLAIPTVAGKDYAVSMSGYLGTLTGYWILRAASSEDGVTTLAQTSARTDSGGVAQVVFKGTGGNVYVAFIAVGGSVGQYGEFDDVSVREVMEWAYAWQLDGVDDRFPLSALPLASTDDFYQAFALRCSTSGANKTFADLLTNPSTGTRLGCLRINGSNALQVVHANDAGGVVTTAGRTVTDGQQLVVEALRVGASHTVFADGAVDIQTALAGNYTTTHATIGARGAGTSEPFLGYIYADIVLKGAPSDAERASVRKFLAQLQGRGL